MRGKRIAQACLCSAVALVLRAATVQAGLSFDSSNSTAFLTHDPDIDSSQDIITVKSPSVVPASTKMPVPPSYHIHNTYPAGAQSPQTNTYAVSSIGQVTNATTASFVLISGSGITQDDPNGAMGPSDLTIKVDLRWNVTSGGFTPSTAYASIPVGFNIGEGGSGYFGVDLTWGVGSGGSGTYHWVDSKTFGPGTSIQTFTTPANAILGDGSQPAGALVRVRGTLTFRADNQTSPSSVFPVNLEVGSSAPGSSWVPNLQGGGFWSDPANWTDGKTVPSGPGQRARFMNGLGFVEGGLVSTGPQTVQIISRVNVGTLDIDSDEPYIFDGLDGDLSFTGVIGRAGASPTVLSIRNANGNANHEFNTRVGLNDPLDMIVDSAGGVLFSREVFGPGSLTKWGQGPAELGFANTYSGGTRIVEGLLRASATGALGTGQVTVDGGTLDYHAIGAADGSVIVNPGGFVSLGITPGAGDVFDVRGGAIGGAPGDLQALNSRNLTLAAGSMIVHQEFDPDPASGNPTGIDPSNPRYIFGVGADMAGDLLTGSTAKSPWIGLGGDPGTHTFGGSWTAQGNAELRVLGGGNLNITARIMGGDSDRIDKTGDGTASIEGTDNPFAGGIFVGAGLLKVNGAIKPSGVTVNPGGSLGGHGTIGGPVDFLKGDGISTPHLVPGGSIGTLTTGPLTLQNDTQLDYELDTPDHSDLVIVGGNLVLDGILNLADTDFGPGTYPLIRYTGSLTDNGLGIGQATSIYDYKIIIDDQGAGLTSSVLLAVTPAVPEPAALGAVTLFSLLLLRRRR